MATLQNLLHEQTRLILDGQKLDNALQQLELEKEIAKRRNDARVPSLTQRPHEDSAVRDVVAALSLAAKEEVIDLTSDDEKPTIKDEPEKLKSVDTDKNSLKVQISGDMKNEKSLGDDVSPAKSIDSKVENSPTAAGDLGPAGSDSAKGKEIIQVKDSTKLQVSTTRTVDGSAVMNSEARLWTPPPSASVESKRPGVKEGSTSTESLNPAGAEPDVDEAEEESEPPGEAVQATPQPIVISNSQLSHADKLLREYRYKGKTYTAWTNKEWWREIMASLTTNNTSLVVTLHRCRAEAARKWTPLEFLQRASCMSILRQAGIQGVPKRKGSKILPQDFQRAVDKPELYKLDKYRTPVWTREPAYRQVLKDLKLVLVDGLYWVNGQVPENYDNLIINAGRPNIPVVEKSNDSTPSATLKSFDQSTPGDDEPTQRTSTTPSTKRPFHAYCETEAETEPESSLPAPSHSSVRLGSSPTLMKRPRTGSSPVEPQ